MPFRESAVRGLDMAPPKTKGAARGTIHGTLLDGLVTFTLRATPLPPTVIDFLLAHTSSIARMVAQGRDETSEEEEVREEREAGESQQETRAMDVGQFWTALEKLFEEAGGEWAGAAERVWCFGPKRIGANMLLDPVGKTAVR